VNLEDVIGEEVSGVAFVRDYVELHFDSPILGLLQKATIRSDGHEAVWPGACSRDMLCGLIGKAVASVVASSETISIVLADGSEVGCSQSGAHAEFAHFVPGIDEPIQVW
jgi:hypothetical protein